MDMLAVAAVVLEDLGRHDPGAGHGVATHGGGAGGYGRPTSLANYLGVSGTSGTVAVAVAFRGMTEILLIIQQDGVVETALLVLLL